MRRGEERLAGRTNRWRHGEGAVEFQRRGNQKGIGRGGWRLSSRVAGKLLSLRAIPLSLVTFSGRWKLLMSKLANCSFASCELVLMQFWLFASGAVDLFRGNKKKDSDIHKM